MSDPVRIQPLIGRVPDELDVEGDAELEESRRLGAGEGISLALKPLSECVPKRVGAYQESRARRIGSTHVSPGMS